MREDTETPRVGAPVMVAGRLAHVEQVGENLATVRFEDGTRVTLPLGEVTAWTE